MLAAALTLALGSGGGTLVLILAGAAVSGLMLAGTALVLNLAPNPYAAYEITHWMLGSLADRGWDQVWLTAPFILVGLALLLGTGRALDALSLGEQQAASLGVDLPRLRRRVLIGTALAVGAATSVSGTIGFIGLVAPHLVRALAGHQPARVLWPSALCGALLLLACRRADTPVAAGQGIEPGCADRSGGHAILHRAGAAAQDGGSVTWRHDADCQRSRIRVTRSSRVILDDISVSAGAGDFVAVIGPNGAGKSTLLSVLAGLLLPDAGSVRLDDRELADCGPRELARRRAFLPQNPRCDWPLPVHRLVGLGLTPMLPAFGDFSASDIARMTPRLPPATSRRSAISR